MILECRAARETPGVRSNTRCYFAALEMRFPRTAAFVDLRYCIVSSDVGRSDDGSRESVRYSFRLPSSGKFKTIAISQPLLSALIADCTICRHTCRPCVDAAPMQVVENMSFERVFHMFRTLGLGYCLITRSGTLIGVLTKKDMLRILKAASTGS
jgi:hypothetical protein